MKRILLSVLIASSIVGCTSRELIVGSSTRSAVSVMGQPVYKSDNDWYWCQKGAHGYKRLATAKVQNGVIVESMQFRFLYSGDCDVLARNWDRERWRP